MKKHLTFLGIAAVATAVFAGCSKDELVESYQGEEISFSTRVATRATSLTLDNLGDFAVIAKGVHPTGDLYTQYLIGGENSGSVEGEIAHKVVGETTNWELDRKVYWPSGMNQVLFWAYTTKNKDNTEDPVLSSGTISFDQRKGAKINGFCPAKANLGEPIGTGNWNDGDNQTDLLIAFKEQQRTGGVSITLDFDHALSQINISASQKGRADTDHRRVKVRGAWIVNVNTKGDLDAGFSWDKTSKTATVNPQWKDPKESGMYGSYTNRAHVLDKDNPQSILGNNSTLMIIPQTVSGWDPEDAAQEQEQAAYILLLCRVELEHEGITHEGTEIGDIKIENGKHYHQLFPVSDKYDDKEYGFSCVPLDINWEMGKSYTYNLDICGGNSGAGLYPPESIYGKVDQLVPSSERTGATPSVIIKGRPAGKNVGDHVLDEPIKFTVNVGSWTDASSDIGM